MAGVERWNDLIYGSEISLLTVDTTAGAETSLSRVVHPLTAHFQVRTTD